MAAGSEERKLAAERWRLLGEKLRERSPVAFRKLIVMLTTSEVDEDEDEPCRIDDVYPFH